MRLTAGVLCTSSASFLSQSSRLPFVRVVCMQCLRMKNTLSNGGSSRRLRSFHEVGNLINPAMLEETERREREK